MEVGKPSRLLLDTEPVLATSMAVLIENLQNMHERSLPPTGARRRTELEYQDWARLQGRGPHMGE